MHKKTLKHLVHFLQEVSTLEQYNRMTPYNLAVCVCPNFFRLSLQGSTSNFYLMMTKMIESYEQAFEQIEDSDQQA